MKVVIVGAGIAGCAIYLELRKHLSALESDLDMTIYEAYDTNKDTDAEEREKGPTPTHSSTLLVGGGLGIAANGLGVIQRLDEELLRDITRDGYVTSVNNMKNKNGSLLMRIEPNGPSKGTGPSAKMNMVGTPRHLVWRRLRMRIPDAHVIRRRVLEVVATGSGRNKVVFADGSNAVEADLVIGADGLHSIVKRSLFPDAEEDPYPPSYQGLVGVGGFVPSKEVKDFVEKGSMNFVFGGNGFFGYFFADSAASAPHRDSPYHVSEPGESLAWWSTYMSKECPDRKNLDEEDVIRQLRERYSGWRDPVVQKIMQSIKVRNMYPTWTSPPIPTWERDGIVLVGDAAHALPSTSGQGVSQALEDCEAFAQFLAHQLRKLGQKEGNNTQTGQSQAITTAARQYIALRQPRVNDVLDSAQTIQNSKRDMGMVQEYAMYGFMKLFGFFPNAVSRPMRKVIEYNIADEVAKVIARK